MITFEKLGAVYSGMNLVGSVLYTTGGTVVSGMSFTGNVVNTAYSSIMPAWAAKTLLIGQVGLGYESIVPNIIRDFALNGSIVIEKAVVGDNYLTLLLNKGLEVFFGMSKFLASELNSGVYQVAKMLPTIVKGLNKDIIEPIADYLFIECLDIDPRSINSEQEIFNHKNINNTIDTISMIGHYLRSTVLESSKSDLELDFSNNNTDYDSTNVDSELYYINNPFSVNNSELICSIS
ncbi:hypothetical protein [Rickettsiales endosymbiont of Trichoplax sp. H2]|uniref:hypothetical protein n=1 Tax=Rickettsiales endosymbiont of Trichoplax sp. H2 TaxID=2021221 RepID=UPI0012B1DBC6|nr:hypothetical protein [Rickettsiales endosymbiont of Trichoplax sp. H2]